MNYNYKQKVNKLNLVELKMIFKGKLHIFQEN